MDDSQITSVGTVDSFVEQYERCRASDPGVSFLRFLPPEDHPHLSDVATELMRVDMELAWAEGNPRRVAHYQRALPQLLSDRQVLEQIAFEEYRIRLQAGENVTGDQYAQQFGIDTGQWPRIVPQTAQPADSGPDDRVLPDRRDVGVPKLAVHVHNFPEPGEEFQGFRLQRLLGQGAFARVFLATQGELSDRLVVLKVEAGHSLEPQHLARLQHTNIVPVYSVHRKGELTAVCMPYLGCHTLANLLQQTRTQRTQPLPEQNLISTFLHRRDETLVEGASDAKMQTSSSPQETSRIVDGLLQSSHVNAVAWITKQLADGLDHAHERGIVHRDLKPANVLLTDEGIPMVLDFNLSEDVVVHGPKSVIVGGTLPYMSPEQLQVISAGGSLGPPTDIYSLGILFYELLTGQRPFPDHRGPFEEIVAAALDDRRNGFASARTVNPAIPPSLAAVVERMLAPEAKNRYQSMAELSDDLDRHLTNRPLRFAPDRSLAERTTKWMRRHPRLSSAGGVAAMAALLLVGIGAAWWARGRVVERLEAEKAFSAFKKQEPQLNMGLALGVPHGESQILIEGIAQAQSSLAPYGVLEDPAWQTTSSFAALTPQDKVDFGRRLAEIFFLLARAHEELARSEPDGQEKNQLLEQARNYNRRAQELFSATAVPTALTWQANHLAGKAADGTVLQKSEDASSVLDEYAAVYDLLDAGSYSTAAPLITKIRDRRPTDPTPWMLLGDANHVVKHLGKAEGCFSTAIALQKNSFNGYFHRGLCRLELQDYPGALADFNEMIRLRPRLAAGYSNRALVYRALHRDELALEDLDKALELGATQTRIYFIQAELYTRLGKVADAQGARKLGLSREPTDELSWVARGMAVLREDPEAALADFRRALKLNPVCVVAMKNCVHVLADRLNRSDEALEMLNRWLRLEQDNVDALAGRAVLLGRRGEREAALADIQQLKQRSQDPRALFQAACALSHTGEVDPVDRAQALTYLSRAVLANPLWLKRAMTDPDLESLRQSEEFATLSELAGKLSELLMQINRPAEARTAQAGSPDAN